MTRGGNLFFIHVTFSLMFTWRDVLTFFLPVPYREAQQSSLNLPPYIGRNVLCGRLPAFVHTVLSTCEPQCWLLRDFIKIGEDRQWATFSPIYSILVPYMDCICSGGCKLWNCSGKRWKYTLISYWWTRSILEKYLTLLWRLFGCVSVFYLHLKLGNLFKRWILHLPGK